MPADRADDPKSDNRTTAARAPSSSGSEEGGSDLAELRRQVQQLAAQLQEHAAASAASLVGRARESGEEAVAGVREVGDNFAHAIDDALKKRPYTTLAVAFGMGFFFAILNR